MPGDNHPLVSILINNFNYARFLDEAISSALNQTYDRIEIIVVDDGSTDNSREIIDRYGDKVIRVYTENGGQGSAINAGFSQSHGELLIFLDADDVLAPEVVEESVRHWDGKATKLAYRMDIIDQKGTVIGQDPSYDSKLPHGDIRSELISTGHYVTPPGSGNIYSRKLIEAVLPIPMEPFRRAADSYLYTLAALHGEIMALPRVGAQYRMHGGNGFLKKRRNSTPKDLEGVLVRHDRCLALINDFANQRGLKNTYSPKFHLAPNFTRLLFLRVKRKLDYGTMFRLLGYIFRGVFNDQSCGIKQRLDTLAKALLVAFAPMPIVWRAYPNTRPASEAATLAKRPDPLPVEK